MPRGLANGTKPRAGTQADEGGTVYPVRSRTPIPRPLFWFYNLIYFVVFFAWSPLFLWKMLWDRSYRRGIGERMGFVAAEPDSDVIWVHGVSVGEVKAAAPIIAGLRAVMPEKRVVVSSTTPTGRQVAEQLYPDARVIYYPLDFARFPARALGRIQPCCVLLMELEVWPNFLRAAEERDVPVMVVNGRISERSFRGYQRISWFLPQLDRIDLFLVQNLTYAARLNELGITASRIRITGNVKYDCLTVMSEPVVPDAEFTELLGIGPEEAVVVAGSTHPGEPRRLAAAVCRLERRLGRSLRLVIAPRHPDKSSGAIDDMRREVAQAGLREAHPVLRLTQERDGARRPVGAPWLVVDTIGDLEKAYSVADVVFVGGSLVRHGGQNMLEPVALGKPTVVGPHVWNFRTDVDLLLAGKGLLQATDEVDLEEKLAFLLSSPAESQALVRRAQQLITDNHGAVDVTLENVLALMKERGV